MNEFMVYEINSDFIRLGSGGKDGAAFSGFHKPEWRVGSIEITHSRMLAQKLAREGLVEFELIIVQMFYICKGGVEGENSAGLSTEAGVQLGIHAGWKLPESGNNIRTSITWVKMKVV